MTLDAFLAENPDIHQFELLMPDLSGIPRGKRVGRAGLAAACRGGMALPGSVFATRPSGESVPASGLVWEIGDADNFCQPVPETLVPMPWTKRPRGQVLMTMLEVDGAPYFADPRTVLTSVLDRYTARGWRPVVALELEFFLVRRPTRGAAAPSPADVPTTGRPQSKGQVYGFEELEDFDALFADIDRSCRSQDVPATTASSEYAPSQFEINLGHVDDPVRAADHAVMLKRLVKGVAGAHGLAASFMAKPFFDQSSNGMHMHFSVLDRTGSNIFAEADDADPLSNPTLHRAVGGLAAGLADYTAIFAPTANAYRRFGPDSYAPMSTSWGLNNRTVAFRVPRSAAAARRIEHRVSGADANPYLVVAAVLASALDGIDRALDPGPPVTGNAYQDQARTIPETWAEALRIFQGSNLVEQAFGARFQRLFHTVKESERRAFERAVTPTEWEWYLTTI